jgi:hypothetical protein
LKIRHLVLSVAAIVAVVVSLVVAVSPAGPVSWATPPTSGPRPLFEWFNASFQGCCFGAGVNDSAIAPLPTVPNGTQTVSVFGSFGVTSWIKLDDGLVVESGNCANSFSPRGACDIYVGIWTPTAWRAYVAGGPLDPLWCFPGNGSCQNISGGYLSSPNLRTLDGLACELVVWNVDTYRLGGTYQVQVYTSQPA